MLATQGTAPLTLAFTDTSTGDDLTYYWDFGDGNTSTLQNPTHTYVTAGFFSVILTVKNDNGSNQASEPIVVNAAGQLWEDDGENGTPPGMPPTMYPPPGMPPPMYPSMDPPGMTPGRPPGRPPTMYPSMDPPGMTPGMPPGMPPGRPPGRPPSMYPGCFAAGTLVQLPNGIKYIEDIEVGDIVKSFDVGTSSTVNSKVTETYVHSDSDYMIINGIIKTTSVHPFYTDGKWIEAGDLSIGDKILHVDGLEHTIETIELSDESAIVYNFEVDGTHNYFAEGYLVHNKRQG